MPIYEYQCKECGHELDALQKLSDPPLLDCPACNAEQLRKKISAPQFRLKGSGWYETDFKKDKRRNLADAPDSAGSKDGASDGKKASSDDKKASSGDKNPPSSSKGGKASSGTTSGD